VALGDSLTAGYGIGLDEAYPALLQDRLDSEGYEFEVVNAGVSGDTAAGASRRLDWVLDGDVRILIVALGGNDGLRGLPVTEMKRHLSTIIERAGQRGIAVLLAGMEAPPNLGESYAVRFREAFRELAGEHDVVFFPFLLQGVAGSASLNQPDGIHPNAEGSRIIAEHLWEYLQPMLDGASAQ
jgi:acyl-CoA thioesterase-1